LHVCPGWLPVSAGGGICAVHIFEPFHKAPKALFQGFLKREPLHKTQKGFCPKGPKKKVEKTNFEPSSGCQDWLCFLLLLSTMGHKQGGSLHAFAVAALPTPSFFYVWLCARLGKTLLQGQSTCGKTLLQGIFFL